MASVAAVPEVSKFEFGCRPGICKSGGLRYIFKNGDIVMPLTSLITLPSRQTNIPDNQDKFSHAKLRCARAFSVAS
jgi:hypothetical protein